MIGETLRKRHAEETYAALKEKEYRQKKRQDSVNKYRRYVLEGVVDFKSKDSQGEVRKTDMSNTVKNPIYEPKGKAKEYGDLALNIYTGCPHRCPYCYAPRVLKRDKEDFHSHIEPRVGIVEATKRQLEGQHITGKTIHLCFTCDPYPTGYDSTATREIIKLIKDSGNNAQILTKGNGSRDFDLLGSDDWFGVTITGGETPEKLHDLSVQLIQAKTLHKISTWVSLEPVIDADRVLKYLLITKFVDKVKIGKLNYYPSDIDWHTFGLEAEEICKARGINYYIKESLREEMR